MLGRDGLSCRSSFVSLQALLPSARAARRGKGKTKNRVDESPLYRERFMLICAKTPGYCERAACSSLHGSHARIGMNARRTPLEGEVSGLEQGHKDQHAAERAHDRGSGRQVSPYRHVAAQSRD